MNTSASWQMPDRLMWETVSLLATPPGAHQAAGGILKAGAFSNPRRAGSVRVWQLTLAPDWTAERLRAVWQEDEGLHEADLRWDGHRRWFDKDRELPPDTREARFVVCREGVFGHTPILRHIGLSASRPRAVEVLEFNIWNGHTSAAPYRYVPHGSGRWTCELHDTELELQVDALGMVEEITDYAQRM